MLADLVPHLPTLLLSLTVLVLVVAQRRDRKRQASPSADQAAALDRLGSELSALTAEVHTLAEYNLTVEDRLLELQQTVAAARQRLTKHRRALEQLGGVIEHEFIRIDHHLVDLEARSDAWTMPVEDDAVEAEFEIEHDPAA